jgi:hypothetical protein
MPHGLKLGNEYAGALGKFYTKTPKSVFAALAYSYAAQSAASASSPRRCARYDKTSYPLATSLGGLGAPSRQSFVTAAAIFGTGSEGSDETTDPKEVIARLKREWSVLGENGIIPQMEGQSVFDVGAGRVFVGEHLEQLEGADCRAAHATSNPAGITQATFRALCDRPKIVPVRTVKSSWQALQR